MKTRLNITPTHSRTSAQKEKHAQYTFLLISRQMKTKLTLPKIDI